MWKFKCHRIKDSLEKGANYLDIRSTTCVANNVRNNESKKFPPCPFFGPRKCRGSYQEYDNTNSKRWNFDAFNRSWLDAITWAMELYRSAAALEHPSAMYNLGIYYGQGRGGLTPNTDTATRLLRLAALKGHEAAAKALQSLDIPKFEESPTTEIWKYSHAPYTQNNTITRNINSLVANPEINFITAVH
ncbi:hypothetical protein EVAR_32413_1 [Eumeta japonica]|uniref:Uncharacterized protein n=1 Tax=Eumeta variegata TaxID=151549 RepID=A0A4C1VKT0_EUMVA|nr:hypothetical protein EVAR_32413_1 [Eumeta japonica]